MGFRGASTGLVEVVLPERLGTWLVVSLLGLPPESTIKDHQLLDGVGEFANMVCGTWLSKANEIDTGERRNFIIVRLRVMGRVRYR